jgi:hypothetical protein
MSRRPDPEKLYQAHRAGHLSRLQAEARLNPDKAEAWISHWETEAALRGLDRRSGEFWAPAWEWIAQKIGPISQR